MFYTMLLKAAVEKHGGRNLSGHYFTPAPPRVGCALIRRLGGAAWAGRRGLTSASRSRKRATTDAAGGDSGGRLAATVSVDFLRATDPFSQCAKKAHEFLVREFLWRQHWLQARTKISGLINVC